VVLVSAASVDDAPQAMEVIAETMLNNNGAIMLRSYLFRVRRRSNQDLAVTRLMNPKYKATGGQGKNRIIFFVSRNPTFAFVRI
jgi:hypothetical protein